MALKRAIFAGGCFWCMVMPFDAYDGVVSVKSGYTGGEEINPSYEDVKAGKTGHLEAVEIVFDDSVISYSKLLEIYWMQIDPTDDGGQFGDRGTSYRTAIFYLDNEQEILAEKSHAALAASGRFLKPIMTRILPESPFYAAEEVHQDYARREPELYEADSAVQERKKFIHNTWKI